MSEQRSGPGCIQGVLWVIALAIGTWAVMAMARDGQVRDCLFDRRLKSIESRLGVKAPEVDARFGSAQFCKPNALDGFLAVPPIPPEVK